jgi:hypothetical protein
MPILTPEYISNLYFFKDKSNNIILLESFSENQQQKITPSRLIQGDVGIYNINVGGMKWESQLSSPVFIMDQSNENENSILNVIDLIGMAFNDDDFILNSNHPITILKSADISFGQEGIRCKTVCWSDESSIQEWLQSENILNPEKPMWIGRIARFYDTELILGNWTHDDNSIPIEKVYVMSGSIKINIDVNEHYFIKNTLDSSAKKAFPDFFVQGYQVSGNLRFSYPFNLPVEIDPLTPYTQMINGTMFVLNIAGITLDFSAEGNSKIVVSGVSKVIQNNSIVAVDVSFESYANKKHKD